MRHTYIGRPGCSLVRSATHCQWQCTKCRTSRTGNCNGSYAYEGNANLGGLGTLPGPVRAPLIAKRVLILSASTAFAGTRGHWPAPCASTGCRRGFAAGCAEQQLHFGLVCACLCAVPTQFRPLPTSNSPSSLHTSLVVPILAPITSRHPQHDQSNPPTAFASSPRRANVVCLFLSGLTGRPVCS